MGVHRNRRERGQASVELVALLPLIALLVIVGVQVAAALNAWSAAHEAARAGARAELVGVPAGTAVRRAVVGAPADDARVRATTTPDGTRRVRVTLPVPHLAPWVTVPAAQSRAQVAP